MKKQAPLLTLLMFTMQSCKDSGSSIIVIIIFLIIFLLFKNRKKDNNVSKSNSKPFSNTDQVIDFDNKESRQNVSIVKNVSIKDFTAFDVETATGERNSICQIGICIVENNEIIKTESFLVQPPDNKYSHANILIHHITPNKTINEPFFPEVWEKIKFYFESQLVISHNSSFDVDCLLKTLYHYNLKAPFFEEYCTYRTTDLSLKKLTEALDIPFENHHDALYDAKACAECYLKLKIGIKPDLSKIKVGQKKNIFSSHERICGDDLKPDLENADPNSPLYNKKVVITGTFSRYTREEIKDILLKVGADINVSISKNTDYVIVGDNAGWVKVEKIETLINQGCKLQKLSEEEFLEIVEDFM